jgi:hypothetical protein
LNVQCHNIKIKSQIWKWESTNCNYNLITLYCFFVTQEFIETSVHSWKHKKPLKKPFRKKVLKCHSKIIHFITIKISIAFHAQMCFFIVRCSTKQNNNFIFHQSQRIISSDSLKPLSTKLKKKNIVSHFMSAFRWKESLSVGK